MGRTGWRRRHLPGGLVWLDIGGNRRKKESLSGIPLPFISLCLFLSTIFTLHLDSLYPFSLFITSVGFLTWRHFLLPDQALYVLWSFILFSHSFHSSLSLFGTFPPHFCLFVCLLTIFSWLHLFIGKELAITLVPVVSRLCHRTKRVGVERRRRAKEMAPHWSQWLQRNMNICLQPPTHVRPDTFDSF